MATPILDAERLRDIRKPGDIAGGRTHGVQANTSPSYPPVPDDGASPMAGIETPATTDNLQGEPA